MDFLTNPFTTALLFLYQFLGQNIILSIVIFTLLIRLVTFPLYQTQIKSSKAMQALQPKLKRLQEKYKGDKEKLAAEQMKMYRENNINPLMGCLPLVIQLPILYGLYGAISRSLAATPLQLLDLYHRIQAPGLSSMVPLQSQFLWLNLGQPDPLYIMPVLVVISTYLQSKLMTPPPTSSDPNDPSVAMSRNMTLMMPLMFGIFSLQFSSGLSIYWIVSNMAGVLQYALAGNKLDIRKLFGKVQPVEALLIEDDELDEELPRKKNLPAKTSADVRRTRAASAVKKKRPTASTPSKAKASKAK